MIKQRTDTAIILTSFAEKMNMESILGTGGWLAPEDREALDWMTLIALMGWKVQLQDPENFQLTDSDNQTIKWIILTGEPDAISSNLWEQLLFITETKKILLITGAGKKNGWLSDHFGIHLCENTSYSNHIDYCRQGSSRQWQLRKPIQIRGLEISGTLDKLVTMEGACIAASSNESVGKVLFFSFHPSSARDAEPVFTSLLKQLLIFESLSPVAWFDWENTLILRMDDPGSAQPAYDNSFHTTKLGEKEWEAVGEELRKRNARMSLAYVSAWVDDGDSSRGHLEIDGQIASRALGNIYPSPSVKYKKAEVSGQPQVLDYTAEFRGIQKLRNEGLVEAELHGYTHIHPDRESWGNATDKYENKSWYREFGRSSISFTSNRPEAEHPLYLGMKAFFDNFQSMPSTLICPGEEFTNNVLQKAMQAGFSLVSSYYLGMRIGQQLCWNQHVCSPYLNLASPHWFDSELPVVGYFHDFDVSAQGLDWFTNNLDAWELAGAKFFIDFRELSHILQYTFGVIENDNQCELNLFSEKSPPFIKPIRIGIHVPGKNMTIKTILKNNQRTYLINSSAFEDGSLLNKI